MSTCSNTIINKLNNIFFSLIFSCQLGIKGKQKSSIHFPLTYTSSLLQTVRKRISFWWILLCKINTLNRIVMNKTLKLNTSSGMKWTQTVPSYWFLKCCITCPLQISSPLKITSGLDKGLSDRAGVCYLDYKKGLGVIPLALDTEVKNWKSKINLVSSYSQIFRQPEWIQPAEKDLSYSSEAFTFVYRESVKLRCLMSSNTQRLGHFVSSVITADTLNYQLASIKSLKMIMYDLLCICILLHAPPAPSHWYT